VATLTSWVKKIIERVPGITESAVRDEIAYTVSDFCREGYPWRMLTDAYSVAVGEQDVAINPVGCDAKCIYVFKAYWGNTELAHAGSRQPSDSTPGNPVAFVCDVSPDIVSLLPAPASSTSEFRALVALAPKDPSTAVPDFFETIHFEAIFHGALGRIYSQPFKPYTSTEAATYSFLQYRNRVNEARSMSLRGYTPAAQNWAFPSFGA